MGAVETTLERIFAAVQAGGSAPLARFGTVGRTFEPSAELLALLGGRALELPPPRPDPQLDARGLGELTAWQAMTLDWLLRGTVAPVGDVGLLCVRDELRIERDTALGVDVVAIAGQQVGLRPSPRLIAAIAGAPRPPPTDDAGVVAAIKAMPSGPVEIVPAEIPVLLQKAANEDDPWSVCLIEALPDPFVYRGPSRDHDCRLHRIRLSTWAAAMKMAEALDPVAPGDLTADELAAIAARLQGLGRPAGDLADVFWRSPRWLPPRVPVAFSDPVLTVQQQGEMLRFIRSGGVYFDAPIARIYDAYPMPSGMLRLWGCFDDSLVKDFGPLPVFTIDAVVARLRAAIGLPRACEQRTTLHELIGREVSRWVDVVFDWDPYYDGARAILPAHLPPPKAGARVQVRGLFEGAAARLRVLQWTAA